MPETSTDSTRQTRTSQPSTPRYPGAIELGDSPVPESLRSSTYDEVMKTLGPDLWLSDEAINTFTSCLAITVNEETSTADVYAFSTFFYGSVVNRGYVRTRKWTKSVDIFAKMVLLVPIHLEDHWIAVAIFPRLRRIAYYNSLDTTMPEVARITNTIFQYLAYEHFDKKGVSFDPSGWKAVAYLAGPHQSNLIDCGVYACTALAEFARWTDMKDPLTSIFDYRPSQRADMKADLEAWHKKGYF